MPGVFISHSSGDRERARQLHSWLTAAGFDRLFLDYHPEDGIPAGASWEHELYEQLRKADACVVLVSPESQSSRWVFAEVALARSAGKVVVPVHVDGAGPHPLLPDVQGVEWPAGDPLPKERLVRGLRTAGLDPEASLHWSEPYVGLRPLGVDDAGVFFGREQEIRDLLGRLGHGDPRSDSRIVAVTGGSGSGKSSLVRSGVAARLAKTDQWVALPALTPGTDPFGELARIMAIAVDPGSVGAARRAIQDRLESSDPQAGGKELAALAADAAAASGQPGARVLLIVDQGEQLLGPGEVARERGRSLLAVVDQAIRGTSPLRAALVFRSQDLRELLGVAPPGLIRTPYVVEPLDAARLRQVVERPAQLAGLRFDPGIVEAMIEEARGGDLLPMLAYALRRLWEGGADQRISVDDYETIGGVNRAIELRAEQILDRHADHDAVFAALLELVTLAPGAPPERRRVRRSTLAPEAVAVLDDFVDAFLVTSRADAGGDATLEFAHESVLRVWRPLGDAVELNRRQLEVRTRLEPTAEDWKHGGGRRGETLSHRLLGETFGALGYEGSLGRPARRWLEQQRARLGDTVTEFLAASVREDRRRRTARWAAAAAAVVIVGLAASFAWRLVEEWRLRAAASGEMVEFAPGTALLGPDGVLAPVELPAFALDRHEVTNRQYQACVDAGACSKPREPGNYPGIDDPARADHPVVYVDAFQAAQFCEWIGRRLPGQREWERAVRGHDGRAWPWEHLEGPTPAHVAVGLDGAQLADSVPMTEAGYDKGSTPEGVLHLIGNVSEWTATPSVYCKEACPRPWNGRDDVESLAVVGFSWADDLTGPDPSFVEALFQGEALGPTVAQLNVGLRCGKEI